MIREIDNAFFLVNLLAVFIRTRKDSLEGFFDIFPRERRHIFDFLFHLHQRNRRRFQKSFVHVFELTGVFRFRFFLNEPFCKLYELFYERKQNDCRRHVEYNVEPRKLHLRIVGHHALQQSHGQFLENPKEDCEKDRTYHVKGEVNKRRTLCVHRRAHRGKRRRYARADIRAKHEKKCVVDIQRSHADHRNENTRRRRRALNNTREYCAEQYQQKRKRCLREDTGKKCI